MGGDFLPAADNPALQSTTSSRKLPWLTLAHLAKYILSAHLFSPFFLVAKLTPRQFDFLLRIER